VKTNKYKKCFNKRKWISRKRKQPVDW